MRDEQRTGGGASLSRPEPACHDSRTCAPCPSGSSRRAARGSGRRPEGSSASATKASSTSRRAGPVVITPNHASFMDPILITIPIHRPLHYMALEPFFRIRGLGAIMRWARAFSRSRREKPTALRFAARSAFCDRASRSSSFPEGGRSLRRSPSSSVPPGRVPARAGHRRLSSCPSRLPGRSRPGRPSQSPAATEAASPSRTTRRSARPTCRPPRIARRGRIS